ncbi:TPA: hypothetical protein WIU09_000961 [Neisseria meningitidis]
MATIGTKQGARKTDVSTYRTAHKASPYESEGIYQYFLYANRKEYDELFVGFVLINQYIFYTEVFFLIGIPSFVRMPAAHIKNGKIRWENTMGKYDGKIRWENTMGKYGTALDIAQYVNLKS